MMSTLLVRKSLEHTAEEYESVAMAARIENVLEPELRRVETPIHQIITRCGGAMRSAQTWDLYNISPFPSLVALLGENANSSLNSIICKVTLAPRARRRHRP
jgi:hypothetical protein